MKNVSDINLLTKISRSYISPLAHFTDFQGEKSFTDL